jgi:excisionase family DNA binding protein
MKPSTTLLTIPEAAARLRRTEAGVRKLIAGGVLPAARLGGRLLIHVAVVEQLERAALPPSDMQFAAGDEKPLAAERDDSAPKSIASTMVGAGGRR